MASTTSTEQSGLFGHLLPVFKKASGIEVRVVALGTGQALDIGRRGDADVVFVHDQVAEEKFVAEGFGVEAPATVMYNDFVLDRPEGRPGQGAKGKDIAAALQQAGRAQAPLRLARRQERHPRRRAALLEGRRHRPRRGQGRLVPERGCGMGPALNTASSMNAYVLADRGTWLSFKNRGDLGDRWSKATSACSTSTA